MRRRLTRDSLRTAPFVVAAGIVAATLTHIPHIQAQATGSTTAPAFEVASVRHNPDARFFQFSLQAGGRLIATGVPVRAMIQQAYRLQDFQIVGGPGWIATERFDVVAKAEGEASRTSQELFLMLRTLLADRFKLTVHMETRELPVFALVAARRGGQLGPRLKRSGSSCAGFVPGISREPIDTSNLRAGLNCALLATANRGRGTTTMNIAGRTIEQFASDLQILVGRTVVNRTGFSGTYDIELEFTSEQLDSLRTSPDAATALEAPSLFTALEEQLGLKAVSERGPVEVLVIDGVELPTEN